VLNTAAERRIRSTARGRQLPDGRGYRRFRAQGRNEKFYLALALVPHRSQNFPMVLRREMGCQQSDRRQVDRALGEQVQNYRKAPRCAGRLDSMIGGMFRQIQELRAVGEEGRAAGAEIQPPRVELGERRDHPRRGFTFVSRAAVHLREQFVVGEA
jgi:hypothetical protein